MAKDQASVKIFDKTVLRLVNLQGALGGLGEAFVDIKGNKIVRIRPFRFDWKVDLNKLTLWKAQRNGRIFEPVKKSVPPPYCLAYKERVYSPNRIMYPIKRIDWDPNGNRNPQNRGKSKFVRISWDEATDIIAAEIRRIQKEYGPKAILVEPAGHSEAKFIHNPHGQMCNLLEHMGGFTQIARDAESFQGWYWGTKHVWGGGFQGLYTGENALKDFLEHGEMLLCWSCDMSSFTWVLTGFGGDQILHFLKSVGVKQVYINPDLNYSAAVFADKWIPIYPGTDAALQLAIAYVWITEGTYKKDYVDTHVVGFDKFKSYVLGEEDGIPKSPKWAAPKCGVPVWTIKALAREFAAKTTSIAHTVGGGMIRGPYGHEAARLESCLLAMQGLGGPGVHQILPFWVGQVRQSIPLNILLNPEAPERFLYPVMALLSPVQEQLIPKPLVMKALLEASHDNPITFYGNTTLGALVTDQFKKYTYPLPKEKGGAEVRMLWSSNPCRPTCWNAGHKSLMSYRTPKLEFILTQHPWMENDCCFSDIVLPTNTFMEVVDLVPNLMPGTPIPSIILAEKAIEPIGESKSDYECVLEIAKKLGLEDVVHQGWPSDEDAVREAYNLIMQDRKDCTLEKLQEQKYHLFGYADDWEKDPPGFRLFYEDPEKNPLDTPSGKLEFYSERLAQHFPNDEERGPMPKWIEKGFVHDERRTSDRAKMFPLLLMSKHPRWRMHAQCDDIPWTREIETCKITGFDGYQYEPVWINPQDAEKRGIKHGDIVKVFNEQGIVLCGAYVTERVMPGVVSVDHGARVDLIADGIDRGGAINCIFPDKTQSRNCAGFAVTSYLVEVERLSMDEYERWRKEYSEAFERKYDPASGLTFEGWVERRIGQ